MKISPRMIFEQITTQTNLRPAGVWDFVIRPDVTTEEGRQEVQEFELLWALAEREAYAAGELTGAPSAAS